MNRFTLTMAVLLALAGAYFPYAWGVAALLRSQPGDAVRETSGIIPERTPTRQFTENAKVAQQHLPNQAWAQDANIQLRDDARNMYVYATRFEQTEQRDALRFEPIAIVMINKDGPMTVVAQSALVQFQREVELGTSNPGRVINARLEGNVEIHGERNLSVIGRQFFYSEKSGRIWSDNPTQFTYEQQRGEADQGIQIDLTISDVDTPGRSLNIEGVERVQLFRHVVMELVLSDAKDEPSNPLFVQCEGSFHVDWRTSNQPALAVFEDKVKVRQATGPKQSDGMDCDRLEVTFSEVASGVAVGGGNDSQSLALKTKLKPTLLVARGSPLVMMSDRSQLRATLGYARYDVEQRLLGLSGSETNPLVLRRNAETKSKPIRIMQANSELECPQISLKHDADRNVREVVCKGEGWLTYLNEKTHKPEMIVEWTEQLRKFPDNSSLLDVVDVTGNAVIRQPAQSSLLHANYIKLWMDPLQPADLKADQKARLNTQPHRMLASDRVTFETPQLQGSTNQLQVWFEDMQLKPSSDAGGIQQAGLSEPTPAPAAEEAPNGKSAKKEKTPPEPMIVSAKQMRVLVKGQPKTGKPGVAELITNGDVRVSQQRALKARPLVLLADQLHLKNEGEAEQVVHLLGQPARVDDPDFGLIGREVHINRTRNVMWVDGEGELSRAIDRDFEGRPMAEPSNLTVHWDEQMVFDGLIAKFTGRVHAALKESSIKCRQMEVHMKNRLSFLKPEPQNEKDLVERIVCRYQVELISTDEEQGNEFRRGRFVEFAMDAAKGIAAAKGPGTFQVWQRGRGRLTGFTPSGVTGANQAMRPRDVGWDYIQLNFNDVMNIKTHRAPSAARRSTAGLTSAPDLSHYERSATCSGQVRVVYGPVDEPLTTFNIDRLPKDAAVLSCDLCQFAQQPARTNGAKATFEFIAEHNARLEARDVNGQADFITYDSSNDLVTFRSLGDNDSMVQHEPKPGVAGTPIIAKTIRLSRSQNRVEVDGASFAEGLQ